MKFFSPTLATVALVATGVAAQDDSPTGAILSEVFGGQNQDTLFTDSSIVSPGQTVHSISIRTDQGVNGVGINLTDRWGKKANVFHGGNVGDLKTLSLGENEFVKCMEAHWGDSNGKTRIRYIKLTTDAGKSISGGTTTTNTATICAPDGFELGGFIGYAGVELNAVGVIWTNLQPID